MDGSTNVRVAVRCRPLSSKEELRGCKEVVAIAGNQVHISGPGIEKDYTFNFAYGPDSRQETVFTDLGAPLIDQALQGYNGTIFAYGQTGSGKTHTMMGHPNDLGIIPRISDALFEAVGAKMSELENARASGEEMKEGEAGETKTMVTVTFLEIYNEVIQDLLNPSGKALNIRESTEKGIYVEGLCELIAHSSKELLQMLQQGNAVRKVAATNMNEQSSRSHSCLTVRIVQRTVQMLEGGVQREKHLKATINLVDLAGSERASKTGASGATLKEGTNINLSLMTLGTVINKLSEGGKATHIPYRDSKLTRLLQESLGGNAATVMIAAISPADYNFDETRGTLVYANRARSIANAVTRNEDSTDRMIRNLKEEIERLKEQLKGGGSGPGASPDPALEQKLRDMEAAQRSAWDELEALSQVLQEERKKNMSSVITDRMKSIKEEKINRMKNIKRLTNEKTALTKRLKKNKATNQNLKATLDENMAQYAELEKRFTAVGENGDEDGEGEVLVEEMQKLLERIESDREDWKMRSTDIKRDKHRLSEIEDQLTEERGELVANANILEEDDKLRISIQEEERAKAKAILDAELAQNKLQMDDERALIRGTVEAEMADRITALNTEINELKKRLSLSESENVDLQRRNRDFKEYNNELLESLSDAELEKETVTEERDGLLETVALLEVKAATAEENTEKLRREMESLLEAGHQSIPRSAAEEERFRMFSTLMDSFERERGEWGKKHATLQESLQSATKDILFLSRKNESLQDALNRALHWEAGIVPSKPRQSNLTSASSTATSSST